MRTIQELLRADRAEILDEATGAVARLEHYRRDGEKATRRRLEALFGEVAGAVERRELGGLTAHAAAVARERWEAGFDFLELLSAFTTLEAAIHRRTVERLSPGDRALGLGLVGTAFAHGKKSLGRAFAELGDSPALDLTPFFRGPYCDADGRAAAESVHPV
jgi:hypothetical protein